MSALRWTAIVNPGSRNGCPAAELARLEARLRGVVGDVLVSRGSDHVATLVRQASRADGFVACGGDGTVFEILQACDRGRQRLVVVPRGRGNSLARDLGVRDERHALSAIVAGVDRAIDVIAVSLRYADGRQWEGVSASNVALGYPAAVATVAGRYRRLGAYSYVAAAVATQPSAFRVRVTSNRYGVDDQDVTGVLISNTRHVGPFLGFSAAVIDDGRADLMVMRAGRARQTMHNISALTGLGFFEPVKVSQVQHLAIEMLEPGPVKIDGEVHERVSGVSVRVLPGAAVFRVPAEHRG